MTRLIVVLGLAGSGKSTQSKLLAEKSGAVWISMGDLLRSKIKDDRRQEMLSGKILDQQEVINMLEPSLYLGDEVNDRQIVLDGFPRGVKQADWLIGQHKLGQVHLEAIIHILAKEKVVKDRLLDRGRQDDNEKAIGERFSEYENTIKPIINEFQKASINVVKVNGEQSIDQVHNEIIKGLIEKGVATV